MKVEIFFVYPIMGIVNKESNLFRIVDNESKREFGSLFDGGKKSI